MQSSNKLKCQVTPEDQLSALRAAYTLLQAGIPHVVWGEYAMAIAHCVPIGHGFFDLQLLVSPYDIVQAAHLICLKHPYTQVDIREAEYWPGDPKYLKPSSTVFLRHQDNPNCYDTNEPPNIYLHTASAFHFDSQDPTVITSDPNPPDESSRQLLYPSLPAFCNAIIDTIHEPPLPFYHHIFYWRWLGKLDSLCGYTVGVNRFTKKKGKLIGSCEWLLQAVKEENRPFLSRLLLDLRFLPLQTSAFERILIKDARW